MAGLVGIAVAAPAAATPANKIEICHKTDAYSNPYVTVLVDMSSVDEANNWDYDGHAGGDHVGPVFDPNTMDQGSEWGDIIPPFTYTFTKHGQGPDEEVTVDFGGYNWTDAGRAIYGNGCNAPEPDPLSVAVSAAAVCHATSDEAADWTFTWTVKNNSVVEVALTSNVPGLVPDGTSLAAGEERKFAKNYGTVGPHSATFTADADGRDSVTGSASATGSEGCGIQTAVSVETSEQCIAGDNPEPAWTLTWTVTNTSTTMADLVAVSGGVTPASYSDVPAGQSRTFTKDVTAAGSYGAAFKAVVGDIESEPDSDDATATGPCGDFTPSVDIAASASFVCVVTGEYTVTWSVTNNSNVAVDLTSSAPGLLPDGTSLAAAGGTWSTTRTVAAGPVSTTFTGTYLGSGEQEYDDSATASTDPQGTCGGGGGGFEASAGTSTSLEICFDDANVTVSASGSGSGTSATSQAEAQGAADAAAAESLRVNLATALESYPGHTVGTCSTEEAGGNPAPVAVPLPATVADDPEEPIGVAVPEAATIPQAVPAGDGASASSTPLWALFLALLGMVGAGIASLRLLGPRE